ncbi:MAG: tRNA pseudouridine(38-40) synthase TruA [Sphingobacteriales bacterium]|nr:tRNA pseudouridine(38-40) synthase TruA [Sphingobacteriales bacterium]
MGRYFIEVAYNGKNYAGFQIQDNAHTIQSEVEKALEIFFKQKFNLTGSSRTDAGVHALQNFFHVDSDIEINNRKIYNINAILPSDIVIKNITQVAAEAHCRFDAVYRYYKYHIYQFKNPFIDDRAFYFPFTLDFELLKQAASIIPQYSDFTSFSKRNTQVKTFNCQILKSEWLKEGDCWAYHVKANRFLRGMVRGLVGTMLQVGRGKLNFEDFKAVIEAKDCSKADFAVPGHGLFLIEVGFQNSKMD